MCRTIFCELEYLYYRFLYSKPKLEIDFVHNRYLVCEDDNLNDIATAFEKVFPDKVKTKITEANLVCEHIFDLLGSGPQKLSSEGKGYQAIDWHSDFKSGYRWNPKTFYRKIRYGHIEGVDVKVPWELSRFQHLNILGQAYVLTKDRKYADEFSDQITDWIRNNSVGFGVNWKCTMDVSIRVANWLVAMEYFFSDDAFSEIFLAQFYRGIHDHAKFIFTHLERSRNLTTNHYLANLSGLFFVAVYCPFFKESRKWLEFSVHELTKEIQKQVYPDGCSFEGSTSYHRLALEMFLYCHLLGKRAGIMFPDEYLHKLKTMFEFSLYCIKPNGMIPQIGDNDNGRFLIFCKRPILEHKYLLTLAAVLYQDCEFKLSDLDLDEEAFWVFGMDSVSTFARLSFRKTPLTSKGFPNAGWYIIRHNNNSCFISCGPNGQSGNGAHAHNDKLSFELMLDGQDIIVDPGTYVYTPYPEGRNKFRSTGYHNTITIDNCEQNKISYELFTLADRVRIISAELTETDEKIVFQGEIQYEDITHKRAITMDKQSDNWNIADILSSEKPLSGKLSFHLIPAISINNNYIYSKKTREKIASIETAGYELERGEYDYSREYVSRTKVIPHPRGQGYSPLLP